MPKINATALSVHPWLLVVEGLQILMASWLNCHLELWRRFDKENADLDFLSPGF